MRVCAAFTAFYLLGVLVIGIGTIVVVEWLDGRIDIGF